MRLGLEAVVLLRFGLLVEAALDGLPTHLEVIRHVATVVRRQALALTGGAVAQPINDLLDVVLWHHLAFGSASVRASVIHFCWKTPAACAASLTRCARETGTRTENVISGTRGTANRARSSGVVKTSRCFFFRVLAFIASSTNVSSPLIITPLVARSRCAESNRGRPLTRRVLFHWPTPPSCH